MTEICLKPIRGNVMRLTKVDSCGSPIHAAKAYAVSDGFVSVELKAAVESGTEYKVKGANDKFIINTLGRSQVKWWDVTINFVGVDPELFAIATGAPLVLDDSATPQTVGVRGRTDVYQDFALEVWTDLDGQACVGGNVAYGYSILPWITGGYIGDWTFENAALTMPISGARTQAGSQWGVGPYNVNKGMQDGLSKPLLTPIGATDHFDFHATYLAPPTAQCGAQTLA